MFDQKAVLSIDLSSGSNGVGIDEVIENEDEEALANMQDARRKRLEEAKANIISAQREAEGDVRSQTSSA